MHGSENINNAYEPVVLSVTHEGLGGRENLLGVGEEGFLEAGGIGYRGVERGDAHEGAVKVLESLFEEDGGDFAGKAAGFGVFVDHEAAVGFANGAEHGFFVEGHK